MRPLRLLLTAALLASVACVGAAREPREPGPAVEAAGLKEWLGLLEVDIQKAQALAQRLRNMTQADRQQLFQAWKTKFNLRFSTTAEEKERLAIFKTNLLAIIEANRQSGRKFFLELNGFSHLTLEEFRKTRLGVRLNPNLQATSAPGLTASAASAVRAAAASKPPKAWDWRDQVEVQPPRQQGGCGSCWAFSAVGAMEIKAQIDKTVADGSSLDWSEQQMVDCFRDFNYGCDGGFYDSAYMELMAMKNGFITNEATYPYKAQPGKCAIKATSQPPANTVTVTGYSPVKAGPLALMQAVSSIGPVNIAISASSFSFRFYGGGVLSGAGCGLELDHAVLVVGYNATAGLGSPDSYWIVRNSWGADWGEAGYIRMAMTDGSVGPCNMYSTMVVLTGTKRAVPRLTGGFDTSPPMPTPCGTIAQPKKGTKMPGSAGTWNSILLSYKERITFGGVDAGTFFKGTALNQVYNNGSRTDCPCEVVAAEGACLGGRIARRTFVTYMCDATLTEDTIIDAAVDDKCKYTLTVATNRVCPSEYECSPPSPT